MKLVCSSMRYMVYDNEGWNERVFVSLSDYSSINRYSLVLGTLAPMVCDMFICEYIDDSSHFQIPPSLFHNPHIVIYVFLGLSRDSFKIHQVIQCHFPTRWRKIGKKTNEQNRKENTITHNEWVRNRLQSLSSDVIHQLSSTITTFRTGVKCNFLTHTRRENE